MDLTGEDCTRLTDDFYSGTWHQEDHSELYTFPFIPYFNHHMFFVTFLLFLSYSDYIDGVGDMQSMMEETVQTPAAAHAHYQSIGNNLTQNHQWTDHTGGLQVVAH